MLIDNGSSFNIFFEATFNKMIVDRELTPITIPYMTSSETASLQGKKITLTVEMEESSQTSLNFMEFLIVDSRLAYHGVLGRSALKDLGVVTSIYYLRMKFSIEQGIKKVRGDQREAWEYYLNSIRKAEPKDVNVIITNMEMLDVGQVRPQIRGCQDNVHSRLVGFLCHRA